MTGRGAIVAGDSLAGGMVAIYPNPAPGGRFFVATPATGQRVWVIVSNVNGTLVYTTALAGPGWVEHSFSPGIYFVRIKTGKLDTVKKFVVQ
jgi:hypothetical protein